MRCLTVASKQLSTQSFGGRGVYGFEKIDIHEYRSFQKLKALGI